MQEFDSNGTKVIIGGRQAGKTTALVQWAQGDPNRVVVTANQQRADALRRMGLTADQAIPYAHATNFLRGRHLEVGVDDVLDYIYADLGVFPAAATIDGVPIVKGANLTIAPIPAAETPAELQAEAIRFIQDENARLRTVLATFLDALDDDAAEPKPTGTAEGYLGTFAAERGEPIPFDAVGRTTYRVGRNAEGGEVRTPAPVEDSDVVSSELPGGGHAPCIDIDQPVRLVESSTPGHYHLYIDVPMTWDQYLAVLTALTVAGVVEPGYLRASILRKGTHLRLPWVHKPSEPVLETVSA